MEQVEEVRTKLKKKGILRYTLSVCPECNMIIPAEIFEREGKVWIRKVCEEHGEVVELYYGSYEMYKRFLTYWKDGKGTRNPNVNASESVCPVNCGLCQYHISHTALANIVVTNRCDLACWYCFFYVRKGIKGAYVYEPTIEQIRQMVRALRAEKPVKGNSVQLTGGEPLLRDDLVEIIKAIREEGIDHIQLNTNGIRLALKPELAIRLREAGVSNLYLSFDGTTPETNPKNHWEVPYALDACRKAGIGVVLVPTVIKGYNDHELGNIIRFAYNNIDTVRSVNFQPVSLTGRVTDSEREKLRITIPDCIQRIEEQTDGMITKDDWYPVPSCTPITMIIEALTIKPKYELSTHPVCGAGTYVFQDAKSNKLIPITRFVDIDGFFEFLEEKADEIKSGKNRYLNAIDILMNIEKFVDKERQPEGLTLQKMLMALLLKHDYKSTGEFHLRSLFLGMMHFQDKYNYDAERVQRCCIHYLTPDGRILPFCAFNVFPEWYRDRVQEKYGIPVEEWEMMTGKRLEDGFYKGELRKGADTKGCLYEFIAKNE
jgi:hypothetical protein